MKISRFRPVYLRSSDTDLLAVMSPIIFILPFVGLYIYIGV